MQNNPAKLGLPQIRNEDHAARILREKIGDPATLNPTQSSVLNPQSSALLPDQRALEQKIIATLQTIFDPEIPLNIYDLGLIYKINIAPTNAVKIDMTLTAPGCPVAGDIVASVKNKIAALPEVPTADVELVWEPAWTRDRLSEAAKLELGLM
jgi:FeS assembly SUF system protein